MARFPLIDVVDDQAGNAWPSAAIWVFAAGTATDSATPTGTAITGSVYAASSGGSALSNPMTTADSVTAVFSLWMDTAQPVDVVAVTGAKHMLRTYPNLSAMQGQGAGGGMVHLTYLAAAGVYATFDPSTASYVHSSTEAGAELTYALAYNGGSVIHVNQSLIATTAITCSVQGAGLIGPYGGNYGPGTTTTAAGSNGVALPTGTINCVSTTQFASAGRLLMTSSVGTQRVAYTGKGATTFTGCTGGTGTMATGGLITQDVPGIYADSTFSSSTDLLSISGGRFHLSGLYISANTFARRSMTLTGDRLMASATTWGPGAGTATSDGSVVISGQYAQLANCNAIGGSIAGSAPAARLTSFDGIWSGGYLRDPQSSAVTLRLDANASGWLITGVHVVGNTGAGAIRVAGGAGVTEDNTFTACYIDGAGAGSAMFQQAAAYGNGSTIFNGCFFQQDSNQSTSIFKIDAGRVTANGCHSYAGSASGGTWTNLANVASGAILLLNGGDYQNLVDNKDSTINASGGDIVPTSNVLLNSTPRDAALWATSVGTGTATTFMVQGAVATSQTTTSATYTDLATAGPECDVTLTHASQIVELTFGADAMTSVAGNPAYVSYSQDAAAAADANGCQTQAATLTTISRSILISGLGQGAHTFQMKYRSDGTRTATFVNRWIKAVAL